MLWEGEGLPKLCLCQSKKPKKPLAENTHGYMRARSRHSHIHTPAERTPRDSTTNLILCWHTIPQMCHAFTTLSLSPSPPYVGILKLEVYSFLSVSAEGWVHTGPEVRVYFVPAAHLFCKPQLPTDCMTLENSGILQKFGLSGSAVLRCFLFLRWAAWEEKFSE